MILETVPTNMVTVLIKNNRVLSVIFLEVVTRFCINKVENQILVVKKLLTYINNIIIVLLNFVVFKFTPIVVLPLVSRTLRCMV